MRRFTGLGAVAAGVLAVVASMSAVAQDASGTIPTSPSRSSCRSHPAGPPISSPASCSRRCRSCSASRWRSRTARAPPATSAWSSPHARRPTAIRSSSATSGRSPSMRRLQGPAGRSQQGLRRHLDHRRHTVAARHRTEISAWLGGRAGRLSQGASRPGELRIAGERQPQPSRHGVVRREGRREDQPRALQGRLGAGRRRHHGRTHPVHVRHHPVDHQPRARRADEGAGRDAQAASGDKGSPDARGRASPTWW